MYICIEVYKIFDNFTEVTEVLGKFFTILRPFFIGIFIAYLLYVPCKKIEDAYKQIGNTVSVPVIKRIAEKIIELIGE